MSKRELIKRYIVFGAGLLISSFGVSFITRANLGTSPISSIPYTLSLGFKPTLGAFTFYMSLLLIVFQIIILRKNFPKYYLLQIPISILFSVFIDFSMNLLAFIEGQSYLVNFVSLVIGCLILGLGIYFEVVADVIMLPGESFVQAVSITFKKDFGKTKVVFDSSMTIIAAVLGLVMFHKLAGVREGTVIASLFVGMNVRFLKRKLSFIELFFVDAVEGVKSLPSQMLDQNLVITVSREYGSSGKLIAQNLAQSLGLDYFDHEIVKLAIKESLFSEEFIEKSEQTMSNSLLYDLFSQYKAVTEMETEIDKLYEIESKIIKEVAQKGNCVIVGRCADHILRNNSNCYHIFIHAKDEFKVSQIMQREGLEETIAKKEIHEINRKRSMHYKYYTGKNWGHSRNYDLCLDVTDLSIEAVVTTIEQCITLCKRSA